MAEGIFKKLIGNKIFVQSAGIFDSLEIDGFTVRVCNEIDVQLNKHRVRALSEVGMQGGFVGSFDLIIPMTEKSLDEVKRLSKYDSVSVEKWLINQPERDIGREEQTLQSYRNTRDIIFDKIQSRFCCYIQT